MTATRRRREAILLRNGRTAVFRPAAVPWLLVVALLTLPALAPPALAGTGIPFVDQITFAAPGEATILMVPDGSGPPLAAARDAEGNVVDATIGVRLVDQDGYPIYMFPPEDIWLQFEVGSGPATGCVFIGYPGGFPADAPTTMDGWTSFSLPLPGGGWTTGPCWVYLAGMPAYDPDLNQWPPLPLRAVSPDLSGDGVVDLVDVGLIATDLLTGYALRSDLHHDGALNLLDVAVLAQHLGATCE
jgi:hypothetical protein